MQVLITGGSGLIGRALSVHLIAHGHQVTVLSRDPDRARAHLPPEVRLLRWDGHTVGNWAAALESTDAVVNLAGASIGGETLPAILTRRWTPAVKQRLRDSRLQAGAALLQAVQHARRRPRVLLQASAVGYYGPTATEVDESSPPGDDFLATLCRAWEASTAAVTDLGVRHVILRTGLVLAPQGGILPVMLLPIRLFVGGPLGSGRQGVSWIHLRDEAAAIRFLLENESTHGAYNLVAPQPVSQAEFARTAARLLRRPYGFPTPAFLLRALLGEKATLVLDGQYVHPRRLLEAGFTFRFPELETALRDLLP